MYTVIYICIYIPNTSQTLSFFAVRGSVLLLLNMANAIFFVTYTHTHTYRENVPSALSSPSTFRTFLFLFIYLRAGFMHNGHDPFFFFIRRFTYRKEIQLDSREV